MDLAKLSDWELLERHTKLVAELEGELRKRKILLTSNKPIGDIAEHLFCVACKWDRAKNSQASFDAIGKTDGLHYQIKSRRIVHDSSNSRQLSAIRGLKEPKHFDFLAAVLFKEDYSIYRAALVPHALLLSLFEAGKHISFQEPTNSHRFMLVDDIWEVDGVEDVTAKLLSVWH